MTERHGISSARLSSPMRAFREPHHDDRVIAGARQNEAVRTMGGYPTQKACPHP
ncbi:hypothetical protein [Bifidobacterium sp.]|uniref:hypothetical protein n=1 Tax=Bifidobacterium sp. TaxID=41200 RepID=UPI0039EB7CEF